MSKVENVRTCPYPQPMEMRNKRKNIVVTLTLFCLVFLFVIAYQLIQNPSRVKISEGVREQAVAEVQRMAIADNTDNFHVQRTIQEQAIQARAQLHESLSALAVPPQVNEAKEIKAIEQTQKHTVASGDTLSSISMKYYGTTKKANQIYEANRDKLPSKDKIKKGMVLTIPKN